MKKVITLAAFALASLVATSAHAQSTISPTPGAPDRPHQTSPTVGPADQITGQQRSDGQKAPNGRAHYKGKKMHGDNMSAADRKEDRKELKMQKKADKAGSM